MALPAAPRILASTALLLVLGAIVASGAREMTSVWGADAAPVLALTSATNPTLVGDPVTLTVTGPAAAAAATVSFRAGATALGTADLSTVSGPQRRGTLTVAGTPIAVHAADFTGDGHVDVAVAVASPAAVHLFAGAGDGTFAAPMAIANEAGALASGDFDGNGTIDLAIAVEATDIIAVWSRDTGNTWVRAQAGFGRAPLAVGDISGSGRPAIVARGLAETDRPIVLLKQPWGWTSSALDRGTGPSAVDHLDADTFADIVTVDRTLTPPVLSIVRSASGGEISVPTVSNPLAVGVTDLNADGRADLVVLDAGAAPSFAGAIAVHLGNADGTFATAVSIATAARPRGFEMADFTTDGKPDVAVLTGDATTAAVTVFAGGDGGTLSARDVLPVGVNAAGLTAADVNGDGRQDLVALAADGAQSAAALLMAETFSRATFTTAALAVGSHALTASFVGGASNVVSQIVQPGTAVATLQTTLPGQAQLGQISDVLFGVTGASTPTGTITVSEQGTVVATVTLGPTGNPGIATAVATLTWRTLGTRPIRAVYSGDRQHAGRVVEQPIEIVRASTATYVSVAPGAPKAGEARAFLATVVPSHPGAGVPTGEVTVQDGDVFVTAPLEPTFGFLGGQFWGSAPAAATIVRAADVNADGRADALVADFNGKVWLRAAGAAATTPVEVARFDTQLHELFVYDATGDAIPDLVGVTLIAVGIATGSGNGTFAPVTWTAGVGGTFGTSVAAAIGDVNKDGRVDLLTVAQTPAPELRAFIATGTVFAPPIATSLPGSALRVAAGDLDSDGRADAAVITRSAGLVPTTTLVALFGDGLGSFSEVASDPAPSARDVAADDLDGDGVAEIVVAAGSAVRLYSAAAFFLDLRATVSFAAEVNRVVPLTIESGLPHLLVATADGRARLVARTEAGALEEQSSSAGGSAAGDVDGDGRLDLVWLRDNEIALARGATVARARVARPGRTSGPAVVSAEYTGDAVFAPSVATLQYFVEAFAPTRFTVEAFPSQSKTGERVTLAATVDLPSIDVPTLVLFASDRSGVLGTAVVNGGSASLQTNALRGGVNVITAHLVGGSTGLATTTHTVAKSESVVLLRSSRNPVLVGTTVTYVASVQGTPLAPFPATGTVSFFRRGDKLLATVPLTAGVATFSTDLLSPGNHEISARYSGDESLVPGSAAMTQGILGQGNACVITSTSPNPSLAGQTVQLRAVCRPFPNSWTAVIKEGGTQLATMTVPASPAEAEEFRDSGPFVAASTSFVLNTPGVHTMGVQTGSGEPLLSHKHVVTERTSVVAVTTLADAGPGSLRQAIADAGDGAEIRFPVAGTIELATLIEIRGKRITIEGPGAEQLAISGRGQHRHFFVTTSNGKADGTPASVTIRGLTLRDGFSRGGNGGRGNGGGGGGAGLGGSLLVDNPGGQVRLERVVLRDNRVQGGRGGDGAGSQRANDEVRDMWGNPGGGGGGIDGNDGGDAEINEDFGDAGGGGHGGVLGGIGGCLRNCAVNNPTGNISAGGPGAGGKGGWQHNNPNTSPFPGVYFSAAGGENSGSGGFGGGSGGGLNLLRSPETLRNTPRADWTDPSTGGFGGGGGGRSYKDRWTTPAGLPPIYPSPKPGAYGGAGATEGERCNLSFWERFSGHTCDGPPGGLNLYSGGGGGGGAGLGGAVFVKAGEIVIADSAFIQNSAVGGSGGATQHGAAASPGQGKGAAVFVHPDGRLSLGGGNTWLGNVASHAFFGSFCPNGLPDLNGVCAPAAIGGIFVESGDDQAVFPGGAFAPIVVRVTGAGGEPLSTSLTLTLPPQAATIDGQSTATLTTDADGRGTFSSIVAGPDAARFRAQLSMTGAAAVDVWFTVKPARPDAVSVRVVEGSPSLASRVSSFAVTVARGAAGSTGSITVLDGTTVLAAQTRVQDEATVFSRMLGHGLRRVRAVYSGDEGQPPTVSPIWWQRVLAEPTRELQRARTINLGPGLGPLTLGQTRNGPIEVLVGHADAVESLEESFGLRRGSAAPLTRPAAGLAVADFTGDGRGDVVVTTGSAGARGTISILSRDQWGVAFGATVVATGQAGGPVAASDVDLDGRADIVTGAPLTLYRQRPDGTFDARVLGGTYRDVALAFINDDDWPDIVALDAESIAIIPGGPQARFGAPIVKDFGAGANAAAIDIGDLNDDGAADVVVATPGLADGGISVFIGAGDGTLEPRRAFAPRIAVADVAIADVGGDGRLDVVAADRTNKKAIVFHGGANGQLGNQQGYDLPAAPRAIAAIDITRDGGTDVIATLDNGSVAFLQASTGELLGFPPPGPGSGAPSIAGPGEITIAEDSVTPPLSFSVGDADTPIDQLVVSVDTSNPALVPSGQILLAGDGATRSITVMPAADRFGTATITIAVSDGTATATHAFAVHVTAVNDAPGISAIGPVATNVSTPTPPIAFTLSDVDTPGEMLSLTATATPPLVAPNGFAFAGDGASRSLVLTPAEGAAGVTTVTIVVNDGAAASSTSFELRVGTTGPPGTPRNFNVRAVENGALMTWDASDDGAPATQFVLEGARMPDLAPLPVIAIDAASRAYRLPLPAGDYAFRLRAANGAGVSDPTETLHVAVAAAGDIPGPPSALRVQVDGTHVSATWSPPVMGPAPTGYRIELGTTPGSNDRGVVDLDSTATTVSAPLVAGAYALRVRARVGDIAGAPSNEAAFSINPAGCLNAPPAPVLLPASVAGLDVVLTWIGDNAPGDTYSLHVGSAAGLGDLAIFDTRSTARTLVARAPASGVYYVFVVAHNACGTSLPSNVGAVVVGR